MKDYKVKIGLEMHCQLTNIKSKLFCHCSADYRRDPPNTHLCPVCLGIPGSLPVMNTHAIEDAVMVALALGCQIQRLNYPYRKNYYYPDMPKNFQISQYDREGAVPFATKGAVTIKAQNFSKDISIIRIQIEEDPGKLAYLGTIDTSPYTLVDYNRAGVGLLEIVTEPVLESPQEARLFLQKLRSILEHLGVSDGGLEGAMRCDANISLAGGKRVEVKNISSFKEVERALSFEISRQHSLLTKGRVVSMETRHWDDIRRVTISLRSKEEEHDYRYFPEADLAPISLSEDYIESVKAVMPELPDARSSRFVREYGLPEYDSNVLTSDKGLAEFFEACIKLYEKPKAVSNWIMTDLLRWLHEEDVEADEAKVSPSQLVEMLRLIDEGSISGKIAKTVLRQMVKTGKSPKEIVEEKGLLRISSEEHIEAVIEKVLEANPKAVQDALTDERAIHFIVGQVMRLTKAKADPELTNRLVKRKLVERTRSTSSPNVG
jgi:aspartyl-tRNA(Asn)/glutamyl-tRNA(Gln) amidotransferase subunit B